jgi:predicted ThiF/HesA family dinucleotide-utilizing enzyme
LKQKKHQNSKKITNFLYIVQVGSQKYIKEFQNIFPFIVLNSQIWLRQLMDDHIVQVGSQKYIKDFQNIFHFIVLNSQIWLNQIMDGRIVQVGSQ